MQKKKTQISLGCGVSGVGRLGFRWPLVIYGGTRPNEVTQINHVAGHLSCRGRSLTFTYFKARNLVPGGRGRDGGAQTSKGALTVQKARMLHRYQLQLTFTKEFLQLRESKQRVKKRVFI